MNFEAIRPYHDHEVHAALATIAQDPRMQAYLEYTFPLQSPEERAEILDAVHSTHDFQARVVYYSLRRVLARSSEGMFSEGFELLQPDTPYLYVSNHRDIVLDAALLNFLLFEHGLTMTAYAIGDNLVRDPFLLALARINRNFLVRRNLPPRELLDSSRTLSAYIQHLLQQERRSVWISQREGRAKDGNDFTHVGVLKMLAMAAPDHDLVSFFKAMRIVPVSISYEQDPTDALKLPEFLAQAKGEAYTKAPDEDLRHILAGLTGQKKGIHYYAGAVLDDELDELRRYAAPNQQLKLLAQIIDRAIIGHYKLWPSNYIAVDLLEGAERYAAHYAQEEKRAFVERMDQALSTVADRETACRSFLHMYANPVYNKAKLLGEDYAI